MTRHFPLGGAAMPWHLTSGEPAEVDMDPGIRDRLDAALTNATDLSSARPLAAGARCLVARHGVVVHDGMAGAAQVHAEGVPLPRPRPVTRDTRFDVASLTKLLGTTASTMALVDHGHLDVSAALGDLVPETIAGARDPRLAAVTVEELLTHRAGLAAWEPLYLHATEPSGALARIVDLALRTEPGRERRYSDLSMILLAEVLRQVSGVTIDRLINEVVVAPLGLTKVSYGPIDGDVAATSWGNPYEQRMIATGEPHAVTGDPRDFEGWRQHTLVGEVNDGNAHHAFGGSAGHAGLFASAQDVARLGQAMLAGLGGVDSPWCPSETVRRFLAPLEPLGAWGGQLAPLGLQGGYGHGGFTGCRLLFEEQRGLVIVLLTNRQHLGEPYPSIESLWQQIVRLCLGAVGGR